MRAHGTFGTLVKFTTAGVSLSKDVFDKAVKSVLGRVNTHGISNLTQYQSKASLNFLCGKDSFACLPTGHGKSLIYQLEQKNLGCGCFRTKKFHFWFEGVIDAKAYANVHFNAYFYGEMTFILVNGETSKRQEKQLFADWRPVILKTKRSQYKI